MDEEIVAKYRNLEINYNDMYEHYRELELENSNLKAKIEQLTEELRLKTKEFELTEKALIKNVNENAELQKQVDEFTAKSIEHVIKYAAKKYHDAIHKLFEKFDCCGCIEDRSTDLWYEDNNTIAKEQFDIEVE